MTGRGDTAYEWGDSEGEKPDYSVLPATLPALPFHCGTLDRHSNISTQGPVAVRQTSFMPRLESLPQAGSHQRSPAVGANLPVSLRSPSCPVPVCNGNDVSARPALGLDMRFGVPAMGVQQFRPRNPPAHQRHLPAAVQARKGSGARAG